MSRPRRAPSILEPIEVKPRAVSVGPRTDIVQLPIASRQPIYARPAVRADDSPATLGDGLRDALLWAVERLRSAPRELDGLLWYPSHPRAFLATLACVLTVAAAIAYCLFEIIRSFFAFS